MDETPVEVAEYDPAWAERFEAERDRLRPWIGAHTTRIEHVGSTSVPGLAAKPIVDVTAVVTDVGALWGTLDKLKVVLGYELGHVPGDWLFLQRTGDDGQAYNLHLVREADEQWRHDVLFREYLRANPGVRREYERVKREAAAEHRTDLGAYNRAKDDFCKSVLERAIEDDAVTLPDASADD